MDFKDKFIITLSILFATSFVFNNYLIERYDMAEEIDKISNNPTIPDTLTGYTDGKVIYIQYMRRK